MLGLHTLRTGGARIPRLCSYLEALEGRDGRPPACMMTVP